MDVINREFKNAQSNNKLSFAQHSSFPPLLSNGWDEEVIYYRKLRKMLMLLSILSRKTYRLM